MRPIGRSLLSLPAGILLAGCLSAEVPDRNAIPNWPVPATWTPPRPAGAIGTMTDISLAIPFVAITPCRIADTRGNGFTGQAGPPALTIAARTFQISGTVSGVPAQCGIPAGADAVSFQFTIVSPNTAGNLIAWPTGGAAPTVSVLNWSAGETALGNGTIVPLSTGGAMSVQINAAVGGATGHLVIDVNGYFADDHAAGQYFEVTGSLDGPMIYGINLSTTGDPDGVRGVMLSSMAPGGSAGVRGMNQGDGFGVFGSSARGIGVFGRGFGAGPDEAFGVIGTTGSTVAGSAGVQGEAGPFSALTYGVRGINSGDAFDSAGVSGRAGLPPNNSSTVFTKSGVRGESKTGNGAIGISEVTGVGGFLMNSANGTLTAEGRLGALFGTDPDAGGPPWGVHAVGAIGATGFKAFLEPHPTDPTRVIQYIALEGPEAGTYFRGRARFQRGLARIPVPEDFRMVTDAEGLTVQITPMGGMATFGVVRADLHEIVVQGSRDLEFSYFVQGVRASFKDVQPVIRDGTFVPQSADAKLPSSLAERQRRVLIENGVYNADGTVNRETARRLGWDRMWERRNATPQPRPEEGSRKDLGSRP